MKILTVTDDCPPYVLGGSGRIAWETSTGLADQEHDVHILTAGDSTQKLQRGNVSIHLIPSLHKRWAHYRSIFSRSREKEVLSVIDEVQPDVIHAHGLAWQMGYRWIPAVLRKQIPVIFTAHGVMHMSYGKVTEKETCLWIHDALRARWTWNPLRNAMIRRLMRGSTTLCVSNALQQILELHGFKNLQTLHNGIDLDFWAPVISQSEARTKLSFPEDVTVFLFAGRIGHDKGALALDRTLPDNCLLIVAGEVPPHSFQRIQTHVTEMHNQSAEQMRLLYAACDVVVVPSIYLDPFPTVCLEAMACARPVIATSHGGAKESVIDGVTGWIVNPLDEASLSDRMSWCRDQRNTLISYGEEGRHHVEKNFSRTGYLDALLSIYDNAVSSSPSL